MTIVRSIGSMPFHMYVPLSNVLRDTKIREHIHQLGGTFGMLNEEVVGGDMCRAYTIVSLEEDSR